MLEDEYPVKVEVAPPRKGQFEQMAIVLDRIYLAGDGYVLSVRSRRVYREAGPGSMRPVAAWEAATVHQLGNRGLLFPVPEQVTLRFGAVRARVNLLLLTKAGFEVTESYRDLLELPRRNEKEGDDGRQEEG